MAIIFELWAECNTNSKLPVMLIRVSPRSLLLFRSEAHRRKKVCCCG